MSNRLNFAKTQALMQIDQANSYSARIREEKRLEDEFAEKVRALTQEQEEYAEDIAGISTGIGAVASLATLIFSQGNITAASAAYGAGKVGGEYAATEFGLADDSGIRDAEAIVDNFDFAITDPDALRWGRNQVFEWESRNQDVAQQVSEDFDNWMDYYDKELFEYGAEGVSDAMSAYQFYEGVSDMTVDAKWAENREEGYLW